MRKYNIHILALLCLVWMLAGCGDSGDTVTRYITGVPWPSPTPTKPVLRDITLSVFDADGIAFAGASVTLTGSAGTFTEGPVDESGVLYISQIAEGGYTVSAAGYSDASAQISIVPETGDYSVQLARSTAETPQFQLTYTDPVTQAKTVIDDSFGRDFILIPMESAPEIKNGAVYELTCAGNVWTAPPVPAGNYRIGSKNTAKSAKSTEKDAPAAPALEYLYLSGTVNISDGSGVLAADIFETITVYLNLVKNGRSLQPSDVTMAILGGLSYNSYEGSAEPLGFRFSGNAVNGDFNLFVRLTDGSRYLIPLNLTDIIPYQIDLDKLLSDRPLFALTSGGNPVTSGDIVLYPQTDSNSLSNVPQICPLVYTGQNGLWQVKGMLQSGNYMVFQSTDNTDFPYFGSEVFTAAAGIKRYESALLPMYSVAAAIYINGVILTENDYTALPLSLQLDGRPLLNIIDDGGTDYFIFSALEGERTLTVTATPEGGQSVTYSGAVNITGSTYLITEEARLTGAPWPFD